MHDRGAFWSAPPEWAQARLAGAGDMRISVRSPGQAWLLSGECNAVLARHGLGTALGPRDICATESFALRLAPDRVLLLSDRALPLEPGWSAVQGAISEVGDAYLQFGIEGSGAASLLALGNEYPFEDASGSASESAQMLFAGLRVLVSRRPSGWQLYVERPWAAALWRWFEQHLEQETS